MRIRGTEFLFLFTMGATVPLAPSHALDAQSSAAPLTKQTVAPIQPIQVIGTSKNRIVLRRLDAQALAKNWTTLASNTPHRTLNADHRVMHFQGPRILPLLQGIPLNTVRNIYAVGSDDYVSSIPVFLLRDYEAILAIQENGTPLSSQRGEQQIVYPTEPGTPKRIPELYAKKAAFWSWYVRSLVIGDLPNEARINEKWIDLHSMAAKGKSVSYAPLSSFSYERQECPKAVAIRLDQLPLHPNSNELLVAHSLAGRRLEIPSLEGYELIISETKKAIPVGCGGPFFLLKAGTKPSSTGGYAPQDYLPLFYEVTIEKKT